MNMTLSKRGDYVMRSAIALARVYEGGRPRKIREVVADTDVPRTFASQILADLVRAGLATSRAGRDGGYRLSRRPEDINVLEVVEAAEGPLRAERCALGDGPCRWEVVCPLHETWTKATTRLAELLAGTTLAEVAARDVAIEAGGYVVPPDAHRSHARTIELSDLVHVELPATAVHQVLDVHRDWGAALDATVREVGMLEVTASPPASLVADCSIDRLTDGGASVPSGSVPGGSVPGGYLLAWRLSEPGRASHFDGELHVAPLDAERCELSVVGTWHQVADDCASATAETFDTRAPRVLRGVLRRIAREVEEGASQPVVRASSRHSAVAG